MLAVGIDRFMNCKTVCLCLSHASRIVVFVTNGMDAIDLFPLLFSDWSFTVEGMNCLQKKPRLFAVSQHNGCFAPTHHAFPFLLLHLAFGVKGRVRTLGLSLLLILA